MNFFKFKTAELVNYVVAISKIAEENVEGYCLNPGSTTPVIRLSKNLINHNRARRQLAIILEEMLHAHAFPLTEKVVRKYAANTSKLLYKFGWRWQKEDDVKMVISKRKNNAKKKNGKTVRSRQKRAGKNSQI